MLRLLAQLVLLFAAAQSTTPGTQPPIAPTLQEAAFDVGSIRPTEPTAPASHISNPLRRSSFTAVNVSLQGLMEVAYATPETRIVGGPEWTKSSRYDVQAKLGPELDQLLASLPLEQARLVKQQMLVRLLATRFGLAVHPQETSMPVYLLVLDKNGPKLQPSDSATTNLRSGRGLISIQGGSDAFDVLTFELSWRLGRPVLNRSGLSGPYHIELTWSPDDNPSPSNTPAGPSIFTAIQEQLGLKLQPAKAPVPTLVIDHAEKASANP